jgi:four helix bundle protein
MRDNPTYDKALSYSVRIVNLYKYLKKEKHEYIISDQLMRSGTSIGANISEAISAESTADFIHKLGVAQKEAYETIYWLKVLYGSELITQEQYDNLMADVETIHKILSASIKTAKEQSIKSI